MELWRQRQEIRQQQHQQDQVKPQAQQANQSQKKLPQSEGRNQILLLRNQAKSIPESGSQLSNRQVDPIESIANVLNQHSKFVQHRNNNNNDNNNKKKKADSAESSVKNKLDQSKDITETPSDHQLNSRRLQQKEKLQNFQTLQSQAKKTASSSQDSNNSLTCSHISNQVDQGNSYLYAYNDFVTSTGALKKGAKFFFAAEPNAGQHQVIASGAPLAKQPAQANQDPNADVQEQTLLDSDEDDNLSYILHQHRPQICDILQYIKLNPLDPETRGQQQQQLQFEANQISEQNLASESLDLFEAHRIDHHLSCARRSHPRHICGIGATRSADHSNQIAARLREESLRAFLLNENQKNKHNYNDKNEQTGHLLVSNETQQENSAQNQKFTHDFNTIQEQIAYVSKSQQKQQVQHQHQYQHQQQLQFSHKANKLKEAPGSLQYIEASNNLGLVGEGFVYANQSVGARDDPCEFVASVTDSSTCSGQTSDLSNSRQSNLLRVAPNSQTSRVNSNRLTSWLFRWPVRATTSQEGGPRKLKGQQTTRNGHKRKRNQKTNDTSVLTMYTNSHHLGGQPGAYYAAGASHGHQQSGDYMHQTPASGYSNRQHHLSLGHNQSQRFPLSSSHSSSMGSSKFANSALRMGDFFESCCSKKCLFISCLMLIALIFIFIISLSAYLNFLININKTNLTPLSGRLRVRTLGDTYDNELANRSSTQFLIKQQQYELILRGAFDRTQALLKSYPNHLVKCDVYAFKEGSLWVYFRLFINKRTLMLDNSLMKRKSPDENIDKQFLPRLTQQTLHSGFEQLMASSTREDLDRSARQPRASTNLNQRDSQVKSFDDQMVRLMPIIESIDLQSIQVAPEFDMLQNVNNQANLAMSDNLRASQLLTTPPPSSTNTPRAEESQSPQRSSTETPTTTAKSLPRPTPAATAQDEVSLTTKKFTLYGYKENSTRPATSSKPSIQIAKTQQESLFLVNHQRKPTVQTSTQVRQKSNQISDTSTRMSNTVKEIIAARPEGEQPNIEEPKEKVVKLISGHPVVSQNNFLKSNADNRLAALNKTAILVNSSSQKLQVNEISPASANLTNSRNSSQKPQNETLVLQMLAPYQKADFSRLTDITSSNGKRLPETSIQELWESALNNRKNITRVEKSDKDQVATTAASSGNQSQPKRLTTVTTINYPKDQEIASNVSSGIPVDWHKSTNSLERPIIGASVANGQPSSFSTSPSPLASGTSTTIGSQVSQKPKISPHLKQGGSLVSATGQRHQDSHSAVLLSRDMQQQSAGSEGQQSTVSNRPTSAPARSSQLRAPDGKPQRKLTPNSNQRNSTTTSGEIQKQRNPKPNGKSQKLKKLPETATGDKNDTGRAIANNKGIRIVDNLLATMNSSLDKQQLVNGTVGVLNNLHNGNRNKTLDGLSFMAIPTLPTTIELTRSTTSMPPSRTTASSRKSEDQVTNTNNRSPPESTRTNGNNNSNSNSNTNTTLASAQRIRIDSAETITESPLLASTSNATISTVGPPYKDPAKDSLVYTNDNRHKPTTASFTIDSGDDPQAARPGTSNFSGQWRGIHNGTHLSDSAGGSSLSAITAKERASNVAASQGSQSPFAMSTAIFEPSDSPVASRTNSMNRNNKPALVRSNSKLSNSYHAATIGAHPNGEFESHRVSRMRQNSLAMSMNSFSSSSLSSTMSSLNVDPNTRLVDDFMITTDKIEGNTRGATLIPPLVFSAMQKIDPLERMKSMVLSAAQPQRTRGPFAFETIKEIGDLPVEIPISDVPQPLETSTGRSERSPKIQTSDQRLLTRKRLFVGVGEDDESATPAPVAHNQLIGGDVSANEQIDQFGDRKPTLASNRFDSSPPKQELPDREPVTLRCPHYGCKAKATLEYTCLNQTQICDDIIDCLDESDELDCVSLLKLDAKTDKPSFSNGAGIIYLNRKGSLAPMCIDYFPMGEEKLKITNSAHDLDADQMDLSKKQQELIRQINTIGQYACSLQSFSQLVSVKINHNNLVDDSNFIRDSNLYHRLSIVNKSNSNSRSSNPFEGPLDIYKSGHSDHEVEISTSTQCPSERTVFVKCGGFDCGQDSFTIADQNKLAKSRNGIIINDFPWLVKLFWRGSVSCHGYLIDESWLISSSRCFDNKTDISEWTAEISHEHYGNDDYKLIESNGRSVKSVLMRPIENIGSPSSLSDSVVLAKLEYPVRFSPLNRPICLPTSAHNKSAAAVQWDKAYRDCVTVTLPLAVSNSSSQRLVMNRIKVLNASTCIKTANSDTKVRDDLICVEETHRANAPTGPKESARILICSATSQNSRTRSKWTVVGVENEEFANESKNNKHLFTSISHQMDWIVDTMNPKTNPIPMNKLEGVAPNEATRGSFSQTCNTFRCSSGECLSWSRICDGLYDCSSHDDEKDCHK